MITFSVNGRPHQIDVEPDTPLLWVLREQLGLTGTKFGCGIAACGACTVHVDGSAVRSCSFPMIAAQGRKITTIEGLSPNRSHPLQQAWIAEQVPQCGYCQSGMIMAAAALLKSVPNPSDKQIAQAMTNICRCGTYQRVKLAIRRAARALLTLSLACLGAAHPTERACAAESAEPRAGLFAPLAAVLTHPRCLNCHTSSDYPRQGSDRHPHLFLVARGADDRGAAGKRCNECHQELNQVNGVPGALNWRLAPLSMAWESEPGTALDSGALCRRLLDPSRNGGRDLTKLEEHLTAEPLVRWAWNPGDDLHGAPREIPPISHEQFMGAVRAWVAGGATCPA